MHGDEWVDLRSIPSARAALESVLEQQRVLVATVRETNRLFLLDEREGLDRVYRLADEQRRIRGSLVFDIPQAYRAILLDELRLPSATERLRRNFSALHSIVEGFPVPERTIHAVVARSECGAGPAYLVVSDRVRKSSNGLRDCVDIIASDA